MPRGLNASPGGPGRWAADATDSDPLFHRAGRSEGVLTPAVRRRAGTRRRSKTWTEAAGKLSGAWTAGEQPPAAHRPSRP